MDQTIMHKISSSFIKKRIIFLLFCSIFFIGCASKIPVPVEQKKPKPVVTKCADVYIVKKDETLFSISIKCGFDYKKVAIANGLKKPYFVKKGDQIRLDILLQDKLKPLKKIETDQVGTIPFNEEEISSETSNTSEFKFGDPVNIDNPKAIREVYSKKSIKKANQVIAQKEKTSRAWQWPTDSSPVNEFDSSAIKKGIEFYGVPGQEIRSVAKGKVIYSGEDLEGYGRLIIIKHKNNILSVYAHQKELLVKEGAEVVAGQTIGTMGSSGTDMVKLLFEIRRDGKSVDPIKFLKQGS
jgi:lipoprotein NlpD